MADQTTTRHGLAAGFPFVAGRCPACGRYGLFLGSGGHITCPQQDCPNPGAADELLDDDETEHVVEFTDTGFTVRHPLRERIGDELFDCHLHEYISLVCVGPPVLPGRYRARQVNGLWTWEALAGD